MNGDVVVIVTGVPGSGKTTLARALAPALGFALMSKDTIKEALFDTLGTGDLAWSQQLGKASHAAMFALAREAGPVVLESFFWPGVSEATFRSLDRPLVQVFCDCPLPLALERYRRRAVSPERHPGHLPTHQTADATAHWSSTEPTPLALDAPLIRVRTDAEVVVADVATDVRAAIERLAID